MAKTPSNKEEPYENPLAAMDRLNADLKKKGTYKESVLSEVTSVMPANPQPPAKDK